MSQRMDKKSKAELLDHIDSQNEQLSRYESRLRDVVRAYKSLTKEKEALERSVKVLSQRHSEKQISATISDDAKHEEQKGNDDQVDSCISRNEVNVTDQIHSGCKPEDDSKQNLEVFKLKEQLATLSSSLVTVSEEKAKISARFQADKKSLMRDAEQRTEEYVRTLDEKEKHIKHLEDQLYDIRLRLKQQQQDRDEDNINYSEVIKELQQLLETERQANDHNKKQIEQLTNDLRHNKSSQNERVEELEKCVTNLTHKLKTAEETNYRLEEERSQPRASEIKLRHDVEDLRAQHMEELTKEQRQLQEAKDRMRAMAHSEEHRIADLERKVSELSELIGSYQREKEQDQHTISRLKEKVIQLNLENTSLTEASINKSQQLESQKATQKQPNLRQNSEYEKVKSEEEALESNPMDEEPDDLLLAYKTSKKELSQVKEELDRLKFHSHLKMLNKSQEHSVEEYRGLQRQIVDLNNKLISERSWFDEKEKEYKESIKYFKTEIKKKQDKFDVEISRIKSESQVKLTEVRNQMQRQRERTIELLADKEAEIDQLKNNPGSNGNLGNTVIQSNISYKIRRYSREMMIDTKESVNRTLSSESGQIYGGTFTEDAVNRLLSMPATATVSSRDGILLHYQQEQTKMEIELATLRKMKVELEGEVRDSNRREQVHMELSNALKEEIRKLERDKSRETANLEYLKNIVLHYMEADNPTSKTQIVRAIATILQFSPKELDRVLKRLSRAGFSPKIR